MVLNSNSNLLVLTYDDNDYINITIDNYITYWNIGRDYNNIITLDEYTIIDGDLLCKKNSYNKVMDIIDNSNEIHNTIMANNSIKLVAIIYTIITCLSLLLPFIYIF